MCAPKMPKIEQVPQRAASTLPDGGDPAIRAADRSKRRAGWSAATIASAATLGSPMTTNTLGTTGG